MPDCRDASAWRFDATLGRRGVSVRHRGRRNIGRCHAFRRDVSA
ncbi:hypothetical protein ACFPN7_39810 [Amycolatopsis halotolerans]